MNAAYGGEVNGAFVARDKHCRLGRTFLQESRELRSSRKLAAENGVAITEGQRHGTTPLSPHHLEHYCGNAPERRSEQIDRSGDPPLDPWHTINELLSGAQIFPARHIDDDIH